MLIPLACLKRYLLKVLQRLSEFMQHYQSLKSSPSGHWQNRVFRPSSIQQPLPTPTFRELLLWNYGIKISCCKTVNNIKSDALFSREMKKCQISSIKGRQTWVVYICSSLLQLLQAEQVHKMATVFIQNDKTIIIINCGRVHLGHFIS